MYQKLPTLLLVDDDEIDRRVVQTAFKRQRIANPVVVAEDGVQALEMLRGENGHTPITAPCFVLLDLNMPRMNGIEFLDAIRADAALKHTVVFMLSTSKAESDKMAAYDRHVAGYLVKSEAGRDFMNHLPLLENYLIAVHFPGSENLAL